MKDINFFNKDKNLFNIFFKIWISTTSSWCTIRKILRADERKMSPPPLPKSPRTPLILISIIYFFLVLKHAWSPFFGYSLTNLKCIK